MAGTANAKKRLERCSVAPAAVRYPHPRPEQALSPVSAQPNRMSGIGRLQAADLPFDVEALS
jgi:hypothetical protein